MLTACTLDETTKVQGVRGAHWARGTTRPFARPKRLRRRPARGAGGIWREAWGPSTAALLQRPPCRWRAQQGAARSSEEQQAPGKHTHARTPAPAIVAAPSSSSHSGSECTWKRKWTRAADEQRRRWRWRWPRVCVGWAMNGRGSARTTTTTARGAALAALCYRSPRAHELSGSLETRKSFFYLFPFATRIAPAETVAESSVHPRPAGLSAHALPRGLHSVHQDGYGRGKQRKGNRDDSERAGTASCRAGGSRRKRRRDRRVSGLGVRGRREGGREEGGSERSRALTTWNEWHKSQTEAHGPQAAGSG